MQVVRPQSGGNKVRRFAPAVEGEAPAGNTDALTVRQDRNDVFAARKLCRRDGLGVVEQRARRDRRLRGSGIKHTNLCAVAEDLVSVVRHPDDTAAEAIERVAQLRFELGLEVAVERRKRLVEQQGLRLGGENARECRALLLPAGELPRPLVGDVRELKTAQQRVRFRGPLPFVPHRDRDVFPHRHVWKQGVLLKEIANVSLLWR